MKFAPNLAYRILPNLSVGAALQVNWSQLDLGDGSAHAFGVGTQLGVIYKPIDALSLGVTYQTPQKHTFKRIRDLNFDGERDTLALEQPQQAVVGIAYDIIPNKLLMEVNGKWLNWADAEGYQDFGWEDQYVIAVGVQAKPVDWLAIRVGYNYGNNPVDENNSWSLADAGSIQSTDNVPTVFREYFKIIGFPAIVEQHITAGLGVNLTKKVSINAGYTHAFEKTVSETSVEGFKLESSLSEDSYEFGVNIMF
jgi:long-chain fatty acid transport protein